MGSHKKKGSFKTIVFLVTAIILIVGGVLVFSLMPSFKISQKRVTVEAGSKFSALSYIESTRNLSKKDIKISQNVDTTKIGKYTVKYTYNSIKKELIVKVCDTVSPKISAKENLTFDLGAEITPEMLISVKDKTECSLKFKNENEDFSKIGNYTVTVIATDEGKNSSKANVSFTVADPDKTPPVISGAEKISLNIGTAFDAKKGVTVKDDFDPAPTLEIDENGLNTKKAGDYTVIYTATDKSGNKVTVKRAVTIKNPEAQKPTNQTAKPVSTPTTKFKFDVTGVKNQPYLVAVNRARCTITVYKKDANGNYTVPYKAFACSVGKADNKNHVTPLGRYNTSKTDRYVWHRMVDNSYGRYAIRIVGQIMFHSVCYHKSGDISTLEYEEYNKLGSPASLGCIRLCVRDIKWIYDNCGVGFPTVIYDDYSSAGPLGKPSSIKIDVNDKTKRGYDPTDWSPASPWNK